MILFYLDGVELLELVAPVNVANRVGAGAHVDL